MPHMNGRNSAREPSGFVLSSGLPERTNQQRVAVFSDFFVDGRRGYVSVGGGIQLAVTPRGAQATHRGRLNEETA
jgi:hypothetical protein